MQGMFSGAEVFNQNLDDWNTSGVLSMQTCSNMQSLLMV